MNRHLKRYLYAGISLRTGILLLILIALYSVIGTLLPQNMPEELYLERYPSAGQLILALSLHRSYSSGIFTALLVLFSLNLLGCSLKSLKGQLKQSKPGYFPAALHSGRKIEIAVDEKTVLHYFRRKKYQIVQDSDGFSAAKHRWGVFGSTITHFGIILIFLAGIVGGVASKEGFVNLLPGHEVSLDDHQFSLRLDDFYITFLEGGAVDQYYSDLTITDKSGSHRKQTIWVNNPLHHQGINFYQSSFGWVSNLVIRDANTGEVLSEQIMQNGQSHFFQPGHISVVLYGYYPELAIGHNQEPVSLSHREINPHYAVILYEFNQLVDTYIVPPDAPIPFKDWEISFSHSTLYSGILFRSDPSYPIAVAGFIIIMAGLLISFYLYPRFAVYCGGTLHTYSRKNGWVYNRAVRTQLNSK